MPAIDASVLLALVMGEPMAAHARRACEGGTLSTVNHAEVLSRLRDYDLPDLAYRELLVALEVELLPLDADGSTAIAELRPATRSAGLSLGDRACLATALAGDGVALTCDRAWADLDVGATIHVLR
jgi:PIN domain nuclease of toxin-antitoxin system